MSETILKIGFDELNRIRFTIEGVTTEMPLSTQQACAFLNEQAVLRKLEKEEADQLSALITEMVRTRDVIQRATVEFVLPSGGA